MPMHCDMFFCYAYIPANSVGKTMKIVEDYSGIGVATG